MAAKNLLPQIARVVRDAKLDGWLFYDFRGSNGVARRLLGISGMLSRRWFLFVPAKGTPTLIVHRIEAGNWAGLLQNEKLERRVFSAHGELDSILREVLAKKKRVAMEYSPRGAVPPVSLVDAGTVERVRETGVEVVSSADLLQHFLVWDDEDRASHARAVSACIGAKDAGFNFIHERLLAKQPVSELEVQAVISDHLNAAGMKFDHPAIVGFAGHAGDPHYAPSEATNRTLEPGMCVLLDIWGGEPGRPMADITWMGFAGKPTKKFLTVWEAVRDARDAALKLLTKKTDLQGWQVDRAARNVIESRKFGAAFTHRLGHSLGRELTHGDGANLDDLETHDERQLLPGTAVTVEPGVYLPDQGIGVRSEVDVLLTPKGATVTTPIQQAPYVLGLSSGVVEYGTEIRLKVPTTPRASEKRTPEKKATVPAAPAPRVTAKPRSSKVTSASGLQVTSYGAARTVTGSNHLVELGGERIMLDCGVFQGSRVLEELNANPFAFDPTSLTGMVLSHAHQDHSGRLPKLVKQGFDKPIYATAATRELVEYLLLDSARLQREDFERNQRKGREAKPPIFTEEDVPPALELFEIVEYDTPFQIGGVRVSLQRAGHIPGSASVLLEADNQRCVFSGDIGNSRKDVLPDPVPCPDANVVLMESTYGDRDHRPFDQTLEEFTGILKSAAERGGKILIPSFALERTQDVLYHIARLEESGDIPKLPVFVDSPLATKIEHVYAHEREEFAENVQAFYRRNQDPFRPARLKYTQSIDESKKLNDLQGAAVYIAGSGMMTGGRILHHLVNQLPNPSTTLVIVGFQPEGGLGRLLVDGNRSIKILGQQVRVRAQVKTVNGFSAHADRTELLHWSERVTGELRLVHGEVPSMEALVKTLQARGQRASIQEPTGYSPTGGRRDEGNE